MGVSYWAYSIIGIEINCADLIKTKTIKAFEHNYPEDWKVDPQSGKELWEEEDSCIINGLDEYFEEEDGFDFKYNVLLEGNPDEGVVYFGLKQSACGLYDNDGKGVFTALSDLNLDDLKAELKRLLEPYGLYNESKVGLYSVLGAG